MLDKECPLCGVGSIENLGTVDDFVRAAIHKAPKERSVDEILREIKVKFKVEVKRWNPDTKKHMTEREVGHLVRWSLKFKPKEFLKDWERLLLESYEGQYLNLQREWILHFDSEEKSLDDLLTNGGRDLIHNAAFMTGAQPAALTYYAICNPVVFTPDPANTTLDTEITTPSGLARHVCTGVVDGVNESFTHGAGGNTTIVVCGFKNNAAPPITGIKGYGNFNLAGPPPAGTLGTESAFTTLDLNQNDILKLTVTLTLG